MLITTKGIVFRFTKYRETSIITNIYTEKFGLSSYIVNGVRAAKGKHKIGYFQPLNLVEITAYHKPGRDIERITEIKAIDPLHSIRQDVHKAAISMFIVEVLNKCIVERNENTSLFNFLYSSILTLENTSGNNSFHLQFLIKLSSFLGFGIHETKTFIDHSNNSLFYSENKPRKVLLALIENELSTETNISPDYRQTILKDILYYYRLQLELPKLKSLEVLQTIFK